MSSLDFSSDTEQRRVGRLMKLHRANRWLFWLSLPMVPLGWIVMCAGVDEGFWLFQLGLIGAGLLVIQSFLVYPFLKCPRCGKPFFLPSGWLGLLSMVDPNCRACIHCGFAEDSIARSKQPDEQVR